MNINPAAMRNIYKANSISENSAGLKGEAAAAGVSGLEKQDTVSISSEALNQQEIRKMVGGIMGDIKKLDSQSRLEKIRSAIENHTYFVSTGDLADAILNWKV